MQKISITEKSLQVDDDMGSQSILIELLDRRSLKYPSSHVLECIKVIFDIFSKIAGHKVQFENFYSGRTKLVQLACATMELEHGTLWRFVCKCNISWWDILRKLFIAVSNCLLSNKVKNYNVLVLKRDNSKPTKFKN